MPKTRTHRTCTTIGARRSSTQNTGAKRVDDNETADFQLSSLYDGAEADEWQNSRWKINVQSLDRL